MPITSQEKYGLSISNNTIIIRFRARDYSKGTMGLLEHTGCKDIFLSLKELSLPFLLAKADIRQKYRRSSLGPFWITISTGVMIACIGLIFGGLFKSPTEDFLPFLTAGLIFWTFISNCLLDATQVFVNSEAIIKQLPIPLFSHVLRMVIRNFYILLHNILIFPIVLLFVQRGVDWNLFYLIPGLVILILNILWVSLLLGVVCTRFRDLTQIVASFLQIFFYVTPIIWLPSLLPERTSLMVLEPNPFYHLLEVVRVPLMSISPSFSDWLFSLLLAIVGWAFTIFFFDRYRSRIAYWL